MKQLSVKIIGTLFLVFFIVTLIPRTFFFLMGDTPPSEWLTSNHFFYGSIIIVGMALILFGMAMNHLVVKRVKELDNASKQVQEGHFDLHIPEHGKDEISSLVQSFNKMIDALKHNEYVNREFVKNFSHEMKTPLAIIRGYTELLHSQTEHSLEVKEYTQIIIEELDHLNQMASQMLILSQVDAQVFIKQEDQFVVSEQIRNHLLRTQFVWEEKGLILQLELEDFQIQHNQELLSHVWRNLIDNAMKYATPHTPIEISLHQVNHTLRFCISNQGQIIHKVDVPALFHSFANQLPSINPKGHGIGLSIVKKIVDKVHGQIEVHTDELGKIEFVVTIPNLM
jgi:signal transduction histidine kinase